MVLGRKENVSSPFTKTTFPIFPRLFGPLGLLFLPAEISAVSLEVYGKMKMPLFQSDDEHLWSWEKSLHWSGQYMREPRQGKRECVEITSNWGSCRVLNLLSFTLNAILFFVVPFVARKAIYCLPCIQVLTKNRTFLIVTSLFQKFRFYPTEGKMAPNHDPRSYDHGLDLNIPDYEIKAEARKPGQF